MVMKGDSDLQSLSDRQIYDLITSHHMWLLFTSYQLKMVTVLGNCRLTTYMQK